MSSVSSNEDHKSDLADLTAHIVGAYGTHCLRATCQGS